MFLSCWVIKTIVMRHRVQKTLCYVFTVNGNKSPILATIISFSHHIPILFIYSVEIPPLQQSASRRRKMIIIVILLLYISIQFHYWKKSQWNTTQTMKWGGKTSSSILYSMRVVLYISEKMKSFGIWEGSEEEENTGSRYPPSTTGR